jgi:hypothetical protein
VGLAVARGRALFSIFFIVACRIPAACALQRSRPVIAALTQFSSRSQRQHLDNSIVDTPSVGSRLNACLLVAAAD